MASSTPPTRGSSDTNDPNSYYNKFYKTNRDQAQTFIRTYTDTQTVVQSSQKVSNIQADITKIVGFIGGIKLAVANNSTYTSSASGYTTTYLKAYNVKTASLKVYLGIKFTALQDGSDSGGSYAALIFSEVTSILSQLDAKLSDLNNQLTAAYKQVDTAKSISAKHKADAAAAASAPVVYPGTNDTKQVIYNVGSVREAYHSANSNYLNELNLEVNTPKKVYEALELWKAVQGHSGSSKGMIQSWIVPQDLSTKVKPAGFSNVSEVNKARYAFQFLYNPPTVVMQFQGTPAVDITLETSGRDKFPIMGSGATSSTIAFQIMINRMPDMKFYDPTTQLLYTETMGKIPSPSELYGEHPPTTEDQKAIYNKGTMYDVEFLLRALLGYTLPNTITGIPSADVGYVGAYPVELHLGLNLRYLVTIDGFRLDHTAFDSRMVPLFSTLSLTCSRLPYPYIPKKKK